MKLNRIALLILPVLAFSSCGDSGEIITDAPAVDTVVVEAVVKNDFFGFNLDEFTVKEDKVKSGYTFSHLFKGTGKTQYQINQIAEWCKSDSVGLRNIRPGDRYYLLQKEQGDSLIPEYLCVRPSLTELVVIDLQKEHSIEKRAKQVTLKESMIEGTIAKGSSLSVTVDNQIKNLTASSYLVHKVAAIMGWSIDFFRLQPEDKFRVIYDQKLVDDTLIGVGDIKALWFEHGGKKFYAFNYEKDGLTGFYDEEGKEMRKPFLKSPLEFGRLTSAFTRRRFHPVQKRFKAHLGTDYAAPTGTPILATGDGVIIARSRTRGNGNYVKIKHNETYSTQYLHMSRFQKGVNVGTAVKQGDVIGYVGSTGLATGPHVCYRFWQNGKQIDHRSLIIESKPMPEEKIPEYLKDIEEIKKQLDQ